MAIYLPRQRDSFGVPARYMDLSSAGLLYTPPGEWRYDSYEVDGDVATLYEENVDLADYQYNADGFDAQVLPAGATAITGGNGMWKIEGGKLYFKMPAGDVWDDTGWGTGFTSVAVHIGWLYNDLSDGTSGQICYCMAVQGGVLYWCFADPDANFTRYAFNNSADWLTVAASATFYAGGVWGTILGTNTAGQMVRASMLAEPESPLSLNAYGAVLGGYTNWQLNGPISTLYGSNLAVYSLGVEKTIGYLFELKSSPAALSYLGDGWTAVSGYAKRVSITSESPYTYTRMYGIRNGNLYSLARSATDQATSWTATLIDDSGDWYKVQFVEPDVAVAIRRVNTAGGGSGSGTIDPLGDVIVSGTSTTLDGTYTLVSGTGESRLWRRDDGYNRYEIYYDSGYWVIHSSYDEMGNGEDYMMHFDECRGAGSDPWTATWETAWEDEWQTPAGNNGTVPTVTGTEA